MQIHVTVDGPEVALARLRKVEGGIVDLTPAMKSVADYAKSYFAGQAFVSQGQVYGQRWPRLNPSYENWKSKKYPGRPVLVRTGLMQRSFESDSDENSATIWNDTDYFKYHQSDESRTSKLPRRAMMAANDTMRQNLYAIINAYVQKQMKY